MTAPDPKKSAFVSSGGCNARRRQCSKHFVRERGDNCDSRPLQLHLSRCPGLDLAGPAAAAPAAAPSRRVCSRFCCAMAASARGYSLAELPAFLVDESEIVCCLRVPTSKRLLE